MKSYLVDGTQYHAQLIEAERMMRGAVERIISEAEARGARVTVVMDEIIIEERE